MRSRCRRRWLAVLALAAAWASPAVAFEPLGAPFAATNPALRAPAPPTSPLAAPGRQPVTLPPAYPAAARGTVPLPSSGPTLVFPGRASPGGNHVWVSGRTETTLSLGPDGRISQGLEYLPGRFERRGEGLPER
jgi:hypothetical protein